MLPQPNTIYVGNMLDVIAPWPDNHFQCVITSIPYYGQRVYHGDQCALWGGDKACEHEWVASGTSPTKQNGTWDSFGKYRVPGDNRGGKRPRATVLATNRNFDYLLNV